MAAAYHLAQCNSGRILAPLESELLKGFVDALDPINAVADATPGFVWRLQTDEGNATSIHAFDDDMLLMNMSVWDSLEALAEFTYRSAHRDILRGRHQWFERATEPYLVLWWIPAGTRPTVDDAVDRLALLPRIGPSPEAFTFRSPFPAPDATSDEQPPVPDDWLCST